MKLIVGITGATGSIFGIRLLLALKRTPVESHLVVSKWGARTIVHETPYTLEQVQQMASKYILADKLTIVLVGDKAKIADQITPYEKSGSGGK